MSSVYPRPLFASGSFIVCRGDGIHPHLPGMYMQGMSRGPRQYLVMYNLPKTPPTALSRPPPPTLPLSSCFPSYISLSVLPPHGMLLLFNITAAAAILDDYITSCTMEVDAELLDLMLVAKRPSNYSRPARQHGSANSTSSFFSQRARHGSTSSELSNPGMVPDHPGSDVEAEDDLAYLENANQLWDTFWPTGAPGSQKNKKNYPALMGLPAATNLGYHKPPSAAAPPYQEGSPHIVSSSTDSLAACEVAIDMAEWPLPPRGLSPSRQCYLTHSQQHSRPPKVQYSVVPRPSPCPSGSTFSVPIRTSSLAHSVSDAPTPMALHPSGRHARPPGLSIPLVGSGAASFSAPVTPAVPDSSNEGKPELPKSSGRGFSRSGNRARANTHEPQSWQRTGHHQGQNHSRPDGHNLPKCASAPSMKSLLRPRTATAKGNGAPAPSYKKASSTSASLPSSSCRGTPASAPSASSRSAFNLSRIASHMDIVPPLPDLTSSFSRIINGRSQNVSVWEDDSEDEGGSAKPSGLSRILMASGHRKSSSKDHKRPCSRDGRDLATGTNGRKRSDTVLSRMLLGRRSR